MMVAEKSTLDVGNWKAPTPQAASPQRAQGFIDPEVIDALKHIDADKYKTWSNMGLALKNEGPQYFPVWVEWSKKSPQSKSVDFESIWDGFHPNGSITKGSLFHLARESGWKDKAEKESKFKIYDLDEIRSGDFKVEYLIDGILVKGQPCLCVGPQKSLKTTLLLYMALLLAVGGKFLGKTCKKSRVLFMSGESGLATLQETILRMLDTLGEYDSEYFHLSPNLPRFDQPLDDLEKLLAKLKIEVLFIDPAYLCMNGTEAGNMFQMGQQLKAVADLCNKLGITLVLAHHSTKEAGKKNRPLDLSGIAWAGFGEFARQWLLLSRRKPYIDGTGDHKLFLRAGGSAGHSQLFNVDISEGVYPNRHWEILDTTKGVIAEREQQFLEDVKSVKKHLQNGPLGKTKLRDAVGINSTRWTYTFDRLVSEGAIVKVSQGRNSKYKLGEKV